MTARKAALPLRRPPRLAPGDTVAFVAPSGPVNPELLAEGRTLIESWGLRVVVGDHALAVHQDFDYLAGADEQRAADFTGAWRDPEVRAVFCLCGGYGVHRMVDLVPWDELRTAPPKVLVGYSDITALHQAVASRLGIVSIHGPMPGTDNFVHDAAAVQRLRTMLFTPEAAMELRRDGTSAVVPGVAHGVTVGGCLALLAGEIGSPTAMVPGEGSLAMLEDVGEDTYRIDGFITHLLRAGWFGGVSGVVLGSWAQCSPVDALLADRLRPLGVPVLADLGFGHCPDPLSIPLGVAVQLDAAAGTVILDQPALS